ncbi:hypothetical protein NDR87_31610 [Nocardia sp. CDC159]|uniref:Uncharacterized protein n=1 Tax=Nocardia pulmonis TaxID=2951408 RepID=A0A9X2EBY0_9NOCA|nr:MULTISPECIES: hypothetical protein [Nocardia]MCM6777902.1 hypothetical protein [Nocardia pulmonis]MCM6790927.1 hypothetical protein [Nocardia sp. CDC159]
MTVRFQIVGPPTEVQKVRDSIEAAFGDRVSTDVEVTNRPATLTRWHGDIASVELLSKPSAVANPLSTNLLGEVAPDLVAAINALATKYSAHDVAIVAAELSNPNGLRGFLNAGKRDQE